MAEFRVTLTPGILKDLSNPIQVRFTSPRRAQAVVIRVLEMESWDNLGDTLSEGGVVGSDPFAEFTGSIDNFRFAPEESRTEEATDDTITLKIQFHGQDQAVDVPIPNAGYDVEGGEIEVGVEVSGEINGQQKEYTTPCPVFVRHPNESGEASRPVETFITANDAFHRAGRAYWQPRSDGLRQYNNLQEILGYLNDGSHLPDGRKWGQINIVAHGNDRQWFVYPHQNSTGEKRLNGEQLEELEHDPYLVTPGTDVIDANTVLVMRGCKLGNNQRLLDAVRQIFGGNLKVLAPKYYQYYEFRGDRNREMFKEGFHFWHIGHGLPNQAQAYARLREEYSEQQIPDDELHELVGDTTNRHVDPQRINFDYTYEGGAQPPSNHAARMDELRAVWQSEEGNFFTEVNDWSWTSSVASAGHGTRVVHYRGQRTRIEYRRVLRDGNGNAVVPDLNNHSHYGRSPAW